MNCKIEGCNNEIKAKGFCWKHYLQQRRHGETLLRTRFDSNDFEIFNDYAVMKVYDIDNIAKINVVVDIEDIERLSQHKWGSNAANGEYYVSTKINRKLVQLSHFLYNQPIPKGCNLSYKDKNTLNNRKSNFVLRTRAELQENTKIPSNNTSGHKGVYQRKKDGKWVAQIKKNGNVHYLGLYPEYEEAVRAREKAEKVYFTSKKK